MKTTILKYSLVFFIGLLIEWWLVWYSPLKLPERIPNTPISVNGILIIALLVTILIIALKRFLRANPDTSILKLTVLGIIICFIAEIIFQAIRQPYLNAKTFNDHLYYFFLGTIGMTIFAAVLSFFVAFQLKTKKTGQLILLIICFVIIINIIKYFFPTFPRQ